MSIFEVVVEPVVRWGEMAAKAVPRALERRRRSKILLQEFSQGGFRWLTLRRLTSAIGLDPDRDEDLDETRRLLVRLPDPGPARPDTTRPSANTPAKPKSEQLWGLRGVVG